MKRLIGFIAFGLLISVQAAFAGYIEIKPEQFILEKPDTAEKPVSKDSGSKETDLKDVKKKRIRGVRFPVVNRSSRIITSIYGWVYGYNDKKPYRFRLASNPHQEALKITPGPHLPGKTAVYWFAVPPFNLKMEKYGLVVYDKSISFGN